MVRFFKDRGHLGLDGTIAASISHIKEADGTVVGTSSENTLNFVMPLHAGQRGGRLKCNFGLVGILDVPDVGVLGHAWGLLLESKLSVSASESVVAAIDLPSNFCNGTFNLVGVFENHKRFGINLLAHVFSLLGGEVLLEHVDFVVLLHATLGSAGKVSGSGSETKGQISVEFLGVTLNVLVIGVIDLSGPSTNNVSHTTVFSFDAICLNSMLRKNGDVVHHDLVGVSQDVAFSDRGVGHLLAHHLGLGILELRMSSELFTEL